MAEERKIKEISDDAASTLRYLSDDETALTIGVGRFRELADALARATAIEEEIAAECERYGLVFRDGAPYGLAALLRHIYNNRDMAIGALNLAIDAMERHLDSLLEGARAAQAAAATGDCAAVERALAAAIEAVPRTLRDR